MANNNIIIAAIGLPGSGKTEVSKFFIDRGFTRVYFGDITFEEIKKRGLETNEKNERLVREDLRAQHGMAAYAILNLPKIKKLFAEGNVIVESMYSWEEYLILKEEFSDNFITIATYASPKTRHNRIVKRKETQKSGERTFSLEEVKSRDHAQIENLHQAGPIAMADFTVNNEGTLEKTMEQIEEIFKIITNRHN